MTNQVFANVGHSLCKWDGIVWKAEIRSGRTFWDGASLLFTVWHHSLIWSNWRLARVCILTWRYLSSILNGDHPFNISGTSGLSTNFEGAFHCQFIKLPFPRGLFNSVLTVPYLMDYFAIPDDFLLVVNNDSSFLYR